LSFLHVIAPSFVLDAPSGGDLVPSLVGAENFFAEQNFWVTFFQKKFSF